MPGLGLGSGSGLSGRLFSLFGLFALAFGVVLALAVAVTLAFDFAITFAFRGFFFLEVLGGGFLDVFVLAVVRVEAFDEGEKSLSLFLGEMNVGFDVGAEGAVFNFSRDVQGCVDHRLGREGLHGRTGESGGKFHDVVGDGGQLDLDAVLIVVGQDLYLRRPTL